MPPPHADDVADDEMPVVGEAVLQDSAAERDRRRADREDQARKFMGALVCSARTHGAESLKVEYGGMHAVVRWSTKRRRRGATSYRDEIDDGSEDGSEDGNEDGSEDESFDANIRGEDGNASSSS